MEESQWYTERPQVVVALANLLSAVHRCCTVLSDLSDISHDRFIESTNSAGMKYYRVDYDLRLTLVSEVGITVLCVNLC